MEIFLCADCGFVGSDTNVVVRTDDTQGEFGIIILNNNFRMRVCPNCSSSSLYFKSCDDSTVATKSNKPTKVKNKNNVARVEQEDNIIEPDLLNEIMDDVKEIENIEKTRKTKETKNRKDIKMESKNTTSSSNRVEDTSKRYKCKCDGCQKNFEAKLHGATKCKECLDALVR